MRLIVLFLVGLLVGAAGAVLAVNAINRGPHYDKAIMTVMGFSFGLATTLSITIVVDMTAANAQGTSNSLRIMCNRAGQFVLPFSAGLVAAAVGLAGLFVVIAAAVATSAAAMVWKRPS